MSADHRALAVRLSWWLGCVAVVLGAGWGGGQLLAAATHRPPPPLPSRVLALAPDAAGALRPGKAYTLTPLWRSKPRKIVIPSIGLRAGIDTISLQPDGALETPPFAHAQWASWYALGPSPGERGPAVIVGHVDSKNKVAVFYYLTRLRPGQTIEVVRDDGNTAIFTVDRMEQTAKAKFPTAAVYGDTRVPSLRLITCGGAYDRSRGAYTDNIIAYAHLTAVRYAGPTHPEA